MNYIIGLAQESIDALNAEEAATLMDILMKLLDPKNSSFKNISLYRGTDAFESQFSMTNYKEPDVSFEYFQYENGKTFW